MTSNDSNSQALSNHSPRLWILLVASAVAAFASGFAFDQTRGKFDDPPESLLNPTEEQQIKYNDERQAALRWSVASSTGIAGGLLVGLLGLGAGVSRSLWTKALISAAIGLALGSVLSGLGGMAGQYYYSVESTSGSRPTLMRSVVMQASFWLPVAVSLATAVGVTTGDLKTFGKLFVLVVIGIVPICLLVPIVGTLVDPLSFKDTIPPISLTQCLVMTGLGGPIFGIVLFFGLAPATNRKQA